MEIVDLKRARMVLYRVQAGADRHPESLDAWPTLR